MRIGIVGAGRVGGSLARHFAAAGHEVMIANSRGPETLGALVSALGERVRAVSADEAMHLSDLVVLSVPFRRYLDLPTTGLAGKTVIDTTNYEPARDGHFPELDADRTTSSELIQAHLPGARVVKAFNTMRWDHLRDYGHEAGALERYGIPVSGDDDRAKRMVLDLVEQIGFQPVDAGNLARGGRRQQPGSPVFAADLTAGELQSRLGQPVR